MRHGAYSKPTMCETDMLKKANRYGYLDANIVRNTQEFCGLMQKSCVFQFENPFYDLPIVASSGTILGRLVKLSCDESLEAAVSLIMPTSIDWSYPSGFDETASQDKIKKFVGGEIELKGNWKGKILGLCASRIASD
ncbi:hypothetical protein SCA6_002911 [Theobroma cacao]